MTDTSKMFNEPIEAVVAERYAVLLDTHDLHSAQPLAAELIRSIVSERDALRAELAEAKAEIERLRGVLEPFAAMLKPHHGALREDHPVMGIEDSIFTVGDLREAVEAMKGSSQ